MPFTPEEQAKINSILHQSQGVPVEDVSPLEREEYLKKFSFAALIWNFFYYQAMGDTLFVWISLSSSVFIVTLPALIPMAFMARRRAWESTKRQWRDFREFQAAQEKWERSSWMALIGLVILGFIGYSLLVPALKNATGNTNLNQDTVKQLQDSLNGD